MRKAGVALRGKSRRKDKQQQQQQQQAESDSSPSSQQPILSQDAVAAITAKNYRLAKELSELRVRYREECRNSTRLSMDNINLASRCRDTMAQFKALKAELKAHKQKLRQLGALAASSPQSVASSSISPKSTEDTLLLSSRSSLGEDKQSDAQLQQQRRVPFERVPVPAVEATTAGAGFSVDDVDTPAVLNHSPTSRTATDLMAEMDRMDRILAEHAHRETCIREEPSLEAADSTMSTVVVPSKEETEEPEEDPQDDATTNTEPEAIIDKDVPTALTVMIPVTSVRRKSSSRRATSPLVSSDDFEEDDDEELAAFNEEDDEAYDEPSPLAADLEGFEHAPRAMDWETNFVPQFYDDEYPQDISSASVKTSKDSHSRMLDVQEESVLATTPNDLSSMDAFEASFSIAAFPESFSPRQQERKRRQQQQRQGSPTALVNHAVSTRRTESPPMDETKIDEANVYNPFTYSPKPEDEMAPPPPVASIPEPLVIKWGSRARDRLRATIPTDPPASSYNSYNKKLSVRHIVDLSSSSTEEPLQVSTLTPASNKRASEFGATPSPTSVSSASAAGSKNSNSAKDKKGSPIVSWDGVRSILPFNKSSPRKSLPSQQFPSTPTQTPRSERDSEVYSTPPSTGASHSIQSSDSFSEPARPQKAGYDAARAKYESATRPRQAKLDAEAIVPNNDIYSDGSTDGSMDGSPSRRFSSLSAERNNRLSADAQVLAAVSVKDRAAAFASPPSPQATAMRSNSYSAPSAGAVYDHGTDSDGDIPLNTSLSRSPMRTNHGERLPDAADDAATSDELLSIQRRISLGDEPVTNNGRQFDPLELESQLKRRSPPQEIMAESREAAVLV